MVGGFHAAADGSVWVSEYNAGVVVRIDPATNTVTARVRVGGQAQAVAGLAGLLWVANTAGYVSAIDPVAGKVVGATVDVGHGVDGLVATPEGLWATTYDRGLVVLIDPASRKIVRRARIQGHVAAIAIANRALWVSDFGHRRVTRIDRKTGCDSREPHDRREAAGTPPGRPRPLGRERRVGHARAPPASLALSSTRMEIAPETHMGPVELTVADLDRTLDYWQRVVGLRVLAREHATASLGADRELVRVVEEPGAEPDHGHTGLYHVALLVPDRPSLARWLAHAARDQVELQGLSDHDVSEAVYLRDPDHHGIEIYADRPRELWEGQVFQRMTTMPLDVQSLLGELDDPATEPFDGLPDGTLMGHVHLRVADVPATVEFYNGVLGMGVMAQLGPAAAFLSAGGYHHHIGANVWESRGASPAPAGAAALRHATIVLPDPAERDLVAGRVADAGQEPQEWENGVLVHDPSRNTLLLTA